MTVTLAVGVAADGAAGDVDVEDGIFGQVEGAPGGPASCRRWR